MVWASIVSIFPNLKDIDDLNINVSPRECIPEERVCGDFSAGLHQQTLAWLLGPMDCIGRHLNHLLNLVSFIEAPLLLA
jgi:hypothetical protein